MHSSKAVLYTKAPGLFVFKITPLNVIFILTSSDLPKCTKQKTSKFFFTVSVQYMIPIKLTMTENVYCITFLI